jgi:protein PhnA
MKMEEEMTLPKCSHCESDMTYELSDIMFGCAECGSEFTQEDVAQASNQFVVLDVSGVELMTGDDVIINQDLPVKGMPKPIKKGTKVKNIKLNPNGKNDHFIDAKINGFGLMALKGSVVKKA